MAFNPDNPMDWVVLGIMIGLLIVCIFALIWFNFLRKRRYRVERAYGGGRKSELASADNAYNAVLTTRSIARVMKRKGINTTAAEEVLKDAQRELEMRRYRTATTLAERARSMLNSMKESGRPEVREEIFFERHEGKLKPDKTEEILKGARVFEEEPSYEPKKDEDISESFKFRSKMPENYMQAKFEITLAENAIIAGKNKGIDTYSAEDQLRQAKEFFEKDDYTSALVLALKAKRNTEGVSEPIAEQKPKPLVQRIPKTLVAPKPAVLEPSSLKEKGAKPEEEKALYCPNCSVPVSPDDIFCRKCGTKLPPSSCPTCRIPVDKEDRFCRKCGTKLVVLTPEGPKYECPVCKTVLPKEATLCPKCGAEFE